MNINLKGTSFQITPDISSYLNKRLEGLEKFLPEDNGSFILTSEERVDEYSRTQRPSRNQTIGQRYPVVSGTGAYIIDVELGKTTSHHQTGDIFRAEINVHIGSRTFRAVAEEQDLRTSIDKMKDQILRELGSNKEKRISILRRGGQKLKSMLRKFYK